jgi:dihydrofolate synthase/folylpolyglutamate synthase
MTAAALLLFRAQGVDLAVMEAGLGGAYDATRALGADLVLMSEVARDHEQVLGPGLDNIARDKAGAFRPSVPAISVPQPAPVEDIFRQYAESLASPLDFSQELPSAFRTALKGRRQRRNAALALDGFQALSGVLDIEVSMAKSREALAKLRLPGRFQLVSGRPEYILDAAHNPAALKALGQTLEQEETPPSAVLFTCLADKALEEMAPLVRAMTSGPMVVPELPGIPRARPAAEVAEALGEGVRTADGAAEALDLLGGERRVLLCGSLFLLAEFFRLRPDCLEIPELGEP